MVYIYDSLNLMRGEIGILFSRGHSDNSLLYVDQPRTHAWQFLLPQLDGQRKGPGFGTIFGVRSAFFNRIKYSSIQNVQTLRLNFDQIVL